MRLRSVSENVVSKTLEVLDYGEPKHSTVQSYNCFSSTAEQKPVPGRYSHVSPIVSGRVQECCSILVPRESEEQRSNSSMSFMTRKRRLRIRMTERISTSWHGSVLLGGLSRPTAQFPAGLRLLLKADATPTPIKNPRRQP